MKILCGPLELKELEDSGTFRGLASVYNNVDLGGDVVLPGAFKEFVLTKDRQIRILDSHNTRAAIGKGRLSDTQTDLAIDGKLNLAVTRAREVHALMKDGIMDGLSIGYDVLPGGAEFREDGVRVLKGLKLWEVSVTIFPMNPEARVGAAKSALACASIAELEDLLREALLLPSRRAKRLASAAWPILAGRETPELDGEQLAALTDHIHSLNKLLKG